MQELTSGEHVVFAPRGGKKTLSEFAEEVKTLSNRFSASNQDDSDDD